MRTEDWGLIDYEASVTRQLEYVEKISAGAEECIVFCTHPPVVTLGRGSKPDDLQGWSGKLVEVSRGGRATYHGPSQMVIYPILDLKRERKSFAARDIHAYLRALENLTVATLRSAGLASSEARTSRVGEVSMTGVWSGPRKIASIGIAVRKWVSYHGIAINVHKDPNAFRGIRPCGFEVDVMTSLEAELEHKIEPKQLKELGGEIFRTGLL